MHPSNALKFAIAIFLSPFAVAFLWGLLVWPLSQLEDTIWQAETIILVGKSSPLLLLMHLLEDLFAAPPIVLVCIFTALYLLPWIVSAFNNHPAKAGIFILNSLLGWTVIGWIIALIWAVTKPQQVIVAQSMPPCPDPSQHSDNHPPD